MSGISKRTLREQWISKIRTNGESIRKQKMLYPLEKDKTLYSKAHVQNLEFIHSTAMKKQT